MVSRNKSIVLWIFAIIFTLSSAIYQRMTGPTHPKKVDVVMQDETYSFKLIRSHGGDDDAEIKLEYPDYFKGKVLYKRYKSHDDWSTALLKRTEDDVCIAKLPHQPPAGKLEYKILIIDKDRNEYIVNEEPVVIRFKGGVPWYILIPHIIFMFTAMLYSTRTGIEAVFGGERTYKYATITLISLGIGGLIFFKYFNFFIDSFNTIFQLLNISINVKTLNIIIPLGISFFTFSAPKTSFPKKLTKAQRFVKIRMKNKIIPKRMYIQFILRDSPAKRMRNKKTGLAIGDISISAL